MEWIYLPDDNREKLIDKQLYLCNGNLLSIDVYCEKSGWVIKHPGETYTAVIPINESDTEWFDGVPSKFGQYLVKRQGLETIWLDGYGIQILDGGRIGWTNDLVPTLKWGKIPFLHKLECDKCKLIYSGE